MRPRAGPGQSSTRGVGTQPGARSKDCRDAFDLDQNTHWEFGNLDGASSRRPVSELRRVDGVEGGEIVKICQKARGFDDTRERSSGRGEDTFEVLHHALGLLRYASQNDGLGGRIERNLSGGEHEAVGDDSLRIRTDRGRRLVRFDNLRFHGCFPLCLTVTIFSVTVYRIY